MEERMKTATSPQDKPPKRRISIYIILFAVLGLILGPLILLILILLGYPEPLPGSEKLAKLKNQQASEVYSSDGELIGLYFFQDRSAVALEEISPWAIKALIATEDIRFYSHRGIDWYSMGRVLIKSILLRQGGSGGGSTVSQQLAKNLFPRRGNGWLNLSINKLREMLIARRLERLYNKSEILELYLNTVSFGENAFGIESASRRFFSKKSSDLNPLEAATLIGMLKATSYYNPRLNPEGSRQRRNTVIALMKRSGVLEDQDTDSLMSSEISLQYSNPGHNTGIATYFREQLRMQLQKMIPRIADSLGIEINLYTDGLKIHTTIDARLQRYAERAVATHMKQLQQAFESDWKGTAKPWENPVLIDRILKTIVAGERTNTGSEEKIETTAHIVEAFGHGGTSLESWTSADSLRHHLKFLQTGFLVMSANNGKLLAWVGGISQEFFAFDHVNYNARRQAGSTFKPIVYASAIENGMAPCTYYDAEQESYGENGKIWRPANASGSYDGQYSLGGALSNSVNTVSVKVLRDTGIPEVLTTAQRMGIRSRLEPVLSLALGTSSVSLMDMVPAYACFINGGYRVDPFFIERIENAQGKVIWEYTPPRRERAIRESTSQIIREFLRQAVDEGTARSLRSEYGFTGDLGGKTGTTQHNSDGWFIGITPGLVAGCWIGAAYPSVHFRSTQLGQGSRSALPVFALFLQQAHRDLSFNYWKTVRFDRLPEEIQQQLECDPYREKTPFFEKLFGKGERRTRRDDRQGKLGRFFDKLRKKKPTD